MPTALASSPPLPALLAGATVGVLLSGVLLQLLQWVARRDRHAGWCALYLAALGTHVLAGLDARLAPLGSVSPVLAAGCGLLFVRQAVPRQSVGASLHWLVDAALGACLVVLLLGLQLSADALRPLGQGCVAASLLLAGLLLQGASRQPGLEPLQGLALAFVVLVPAAIEPLLPRPGLLAPPDWPDAALHGGAALQALILGVALSFEQRPDASTWPLVRRAARDPQTGFHAAPELAAQVNAVLLRHRRHGVGGALVLFEISNWRDLTLAHGEAVIEPMLKAAQRLVAANLRDTDIAVRAAKSRLALVLTRGAACHEVLAIAQRVIDQGLRHAPELPAHERLHFHAVVAYLSGDVPARAQALLQALHRALDQARPGSGLALRELSDLPA